MIKNAAPMMTSYVTPLIEVLVPPTDLSYSALKGGKLYNKVFVKVINTMKC